MSDVVHMYRDSVDRGDQDRFSCPVSVWELLVELGRTFGWRPTGTTYIVPPRLNIDAPARRDYQPGNALDYKRVGAEDAAAWASALELGKRSPHFAAMLEARATAVAESGRTRAELLPGTLEEFIEFAYGGAFSFAVTADSDGSAVPAQKAE